MKKVFAKVFFTEKTIYPDWLSKQDVLSEKAEYEILNIKIKCNNK